MATWTPATGRPTSTPFPRPEVSSSSRVTSATGSASVMPYGVCASQPPNTSDAARSVSRGTGAPAESSRRTRSHRSRCAESSLDAVRTMLRSAAGAANTSVASMDETASASAREVSVPGLLMSMSGTADVMPRAGPKSANGAKAATSRSSGWMPNVPRTISRCASSCACRYTTPFAGPVAPEVKSTAASAVRDGVVDVGSCRPIWASSTTV
jgi:hypothetical protein